jgi:hypothetical protein
LRQRAGAHQEGKEKCRKAMAHGGCAINQWVGASVIADKEKAPSRRFAGGAI